jgi:hypothetical protein
MIDRPARYPLSATVMTVTVSLVGNLRRWLVGMW